MHTDTGAGGYGDSTNGAPSIKHTISERLPVYFITTIRLPRFRGGRNATTTTSTWHGSNLTPHHMLGEQGPPSIGSHGHRYGQAPQLQAINKKCKIQKGVEPIISNKFGQLANNIGGRSRIKNSTNTIEYIFKHKVPTERKWDVRYGQFLCTV